MSSPLLSLFLLLLASSIHPISSQPCNKADMATLLSIKNSFGNPSELASWNSDRAADCCSSWRGVGCNADGRVSSVGIFQTAVSGGPIPSIIGNLSALAIIDFFQLANLVGPIPTSIAKLSSLTQLTISSNAISGDIPSFLCNLPKVNYLDLSGNQLTGKIPSCLMARAKGSTPVLKLYQNQLTGVIPSSFASIDFAAVDLSHNKLTGDASFLFGAGKKSADSINLSWNELEFNLTPVRFPLSLTQLDLSHNKMRGRIPQQLTKLSKLSSLDVSYNMLCGPIPQMKAFMEMPSAFEHNKCLCGKPLSPCGRLFRI